MSINAFLKEITVQISKVKTEDDVKFILECEPYLTELGIPVTPKEMNTFGLKNIFSFMVSSFNEEGFLKKAFALHQLAGICKKHNRIKPNLVESIQKNIFEYASDCMQSFLIRKKNSKNPKNSNYFKTKKNELEKVLYEIFEDATKDAVKKSITKIKEKDRTQKKQKIDKTKKSHASLSRNFNLDNLKTGYDLYKLKQSLSNEYKFNDTKFKNYNMLINEHVNIDRHSSVINPQINEKNKILNSVIKDSELLTLKRHHREISSKLDSAYNSTNQMVSKLRLKGKNLTNKMGNLIKSGIQSSKIKNLTESNLKLHENMEKVRPKLRNRTYDLKKRMKENVPYTSQDIKTTHKLYQDYNNDLIKFKENIDCLKEILKLIKPNSKDFNSISLVIMESEKLYDQFKHTGNESISTIESAQERLLSVIDKLEDYIENREQNRKMGARDKSSYKSRDSKLEAANKFKNNILSFSQEELSENNIKSLSDGSLRKSISEFSSFDSDSMGKRLSSNLSSDEDISDFEDDDELEQRYSEQSRLI